MAMPLRARTRRVPVFERIVLGEGGTSNGEQFVFCASREKTIRLRSCEGCPYLLLAASEAVDGALVVSCAPPTRRALGR